MKITKANAILVLVLVFILTLTSLFFSRKLVFSYDFESFFPDNSPALPFFKQYRQAFGHDNEFVLLALENEKGIFQKDFLTKVDSLGKQLKRIEFIENVVSPANLKQTSLQGFASTQTPLLHLYNPNLYKDDSAFIYSLPQWKNNFFATDAKSLCIYVKTKDGLSKKKSDKLADAIKSVVNTNGCRQYHVAGRIFAQAIFLEKLQKQFVLFILISAIFVTLLLWFTFRKLQAVLLPLSLILISLIITFGLMAALGKPIDIMTAMIPTMIFVAGMSDVIHFYTKFSDEINAGNSTDNTLKVIFKEVAQPTFLTLVSTVVGFLSLCWSGIKPVRDFGIYTSVGIVIAFILTYTYLPAMLVVIKSKGKRQELKSKLEVNSDGLFFWVIRYGKQISIVTISLVVLAFSGGSKIISDQKLLDDLSDKEPIKKDFMFFEEHYGGVRPLEIDITTSTQTIWNYDVMKQLNLVDSFIATNYQAGFLVSPVSIVKSVNQAYDGSYIFPNDTADFNRDVKFILQNKHNKDYQKLVSENQKHSHISAKIKDLGSLEVNQLNEKLNNFIKTKTDTNYVKLTITGTANLIDLNNNYLVENTLQGLLTGILSLALLTLIIHRSLKMVIVFLIPNVVPLLVMAGLMGFLGIPLKASTAIFFSIAFGIATDDTIHFISRFKLELKKNTSALRAFKHTYAETGKPVFLTTIILLGGFISLILSDFESIRLFGLLTCLTLLVALVAEILLLPVLLMLLFRKKN